MDPRFSFEYNGEYVVQAKLEENFEARPLIKTLEIMDPQIAVKWIDRFSPFEAVASEWALASILEKAHFSTNILRGILDACPE